jgi:hypothetical protein
MWREGSGDCQAADTAKVEIRRGPFAVSPQVNGACSLLEVASEGGRLGRGDTTATAKTARLWRRGAATELKRARAHHHHIHHHHHSIRTHISNSAAAAEEAAAAAEAAASAETTLSLYLFL